MSKWYAERSRVFRASCFWAIFWCKPSWWGCEIIFSNCVHVILEFHLILDVLMIDGKNLAPLVCDQISPKIMQIFARTAWSWHQRLWPGYPIQQSTKLQNFIRIVIYILWWWLERNDSHDVCSSARKLGDICGIDAASSRSYYSVKWCSNWY